jgi:hypothetical protein
MTLIDSYRYPDLNAMAVSEQQYPEVQEEWYPEAKVVACWKQQDEP